MEQYVHTLIAADSGFVPKPSQVEKFFELLTTNYHFRIISDGRFQPGLRLMKPSGESRSVTNPMTRESLSMPIFDRIKIENLSDLSRAAEGLESYSVLASGEWALEKPFILLTTEEIPFTGSYLCEASCHIQPEPVSTSCWDEEAGPNDLKVPYFGDPCEMKNSNGTFSHPLTGKPIRVADAGCARFWIEFEFGKFLLPKMDDSLNILSPTMVTKIEDCFGTRLVQAWRFN